MNQFDTLHVGRYCTITNHLDDLEVKVMDFGMFVLKILVNVFISLCLLKMLMDQVDQFDTCTLLVGTIEHQIVMKISTLLAFLTSWDTSQAAQPQKVATGKCYVKGPLNATIRYHS